MATKTDFSSATTKHFYDWLQHQGYSPQNFDGALSDQYDKFGSQVCREGEKNNRIESQEVYALVFSNFDQYSKSLLKTEKDPFKKIGLDLSWLKSDSSGKDLFQVSDEFKKKVTLHLLGSDSKSGALHQAFEQLQKIFHFSKNDPRLAKELMRWAFTQSEMKLLPLEDQKKIIVQFAQNLSLNFSEQENVREILQSELIHLRRGLMLPQIAAHAASLEGLHLESQGHLRQAQKLYQLAFEMDPQQSLAHQKRAAYLLQDPDVEISVAKHHLIESIRFEKSALHLLEIIPLLQNKQHPLTKDAWSYLIDKRAKLGFVEDVFLLYQKAHEENPSALKYEDGLRAFIQKHELDSGVTAEVDVKTLQLEKKCKIFKELLLNNKYDQAQILLNEMKEVHDRRMGDQAKLLYEQKDFDGKTLILDAALKFYQLQINEHRTQDLDALEKIEKDKEWVLSILELGLEKNPRDLQGILLKREMDHSLSHYSAAVLDYARAMKEALPSDRKLIQLEYENYRQELKELYEETHQQRILVESKIIPDATLTVLLMDQELELLQAFSIIAGSGYSQGLYSSQISSAQKLSEYQKWNQTIADLTQKKSEWSQKTGIENYQLQLDPMIEKSELKNEDLKEVYSGQYFDYLRIDDHKLVLTEKFYTLNPKQQLEKLQYIHRMALIQMNQKLMNTESNPLRKKFYEAQELLLKDEMIPARLKFEEFRKQSEGSTDKITLQLRTEAGEILKPFALAAIDQLKERNQILKNQRLSADRDHMIHFNDQNDAFLKILKDAIESDKAATLEEAIAFLSKEDLRLREEFLANPVIPKKWVVEEEHLFKERVYYQDYSDALNQLERKIEKDPSATDPQIPTLKLEGGAYSTKGFTQIRPVKIVIGKEGGVIVDGTVSYCFPKSNEEHVVLLGFISGPHFIHLTREQDYKVEYNYYPQGSRQDYAHGHPGSLTQLLDRYQGWRADTAFAVLCEAEMKVGLSQRQTPDEDRRYHIQMAKSLRDKWEYSLAGEILEKVFAKEVDNIRLETPDLSIEEVKKEVEKDRSKFEEAIRKQLEKQGSTVSDEQFKKIVDDAIAAKVELTLRRKTYPVLSDRVENGKISDPTAREAWKIYNDMLDPNDEWMNLSDQSWDLITTELIVTAVTLPLTMGVGTAVRAGLRGTSIAIRLMNAGRWARLATEAVIFTTASLAEGLVQEGTSSMMSGRDFEWKGVGMNMVMSRAFHTGNIVWGKFATELGIGERAIERASGFQKFKLKALNFSGTMTFQTSMSVAYSYAIEAITGDENPLNLWDRVWGEAARQLGYHYGTKGINVLTRNRLAQAEERSMIKAKISQEEYQRYVEKIQSGSMTHEQAVLLSLEKAQKKVPSIFDGDKAQKIYQNHALEHANEWVQKMGVNPHTNNGKALANFLVFHAFENNKSVIELQREVQGKEFSNLKEYVQNAFGLNPESEGGKYAVAALSSALIEGRESKALAQHFPELARFVDEKVAFISTLAQKHDILKGLKTSVLQEVLLNKALLENASEADLSTHLKNIESHLEHLSSSIESLCHLLKMNDLHQRQALFEWALREGKSAEDLKHEVDLVLEGKTQWSFKKNKILRTFTPEDQILAVKQSVLEKLPELPADDFLFLDSDSIPAEDRFSLMLGFSDSLLHQAGYEVTHPEYHVIQEKLLQDWQAMDRGEGSYESVSWMQEAQGIEQRLKEGGEIRFYVQEDGVFKDDYIALRKKKKVASSSLKASETMAIAYRAKRWVEAAKIDTETNEGKEMMRALHGRWLSLKENGQSWQADASDLLTHWQTQRIENLRVENGEFVFDTKKKSYEEVTRKGKNPLLSIHASKPSDESFMNEAPTSSILLSVDLKKEGSSSEIRPSEYEVKLKTASGENTVTALLDVSLTRDYFKSPEANLKNAYRFIDLNRSYTLKEGDTLHFTGEILGQGSTGTIFVAEKKTPQGHKEKVTVKIRTHGMAPEEYLESKVKEEGRAAAFLSKIDPLYQSSQVLDLGNGRAAFVGPYFDPKDSIFFDSLSRLNDAQKQQVIPEIEKLFREIASRGAELGDVEFVLTSNGKVHLIDIEGLRFNRFDPENVQDKNRALQQMRHSYGLPDPQKTYQKNLESMKHELLDLLSTLKNERDHEEGKKWIKEAQRLKGKVQALSEELQKNPTHDFEDRIQSLKQEVQKYHEAVLERPRKILRVEIESFHLANEGLFDFIQDSSLQKAYEGWKKRYDSFKDSTFETAKIQNEFQFLREQMQDRLIQKFWGNQKTVPPRLKEVIQQKWESLFKIHFSNQKVDAQAYQAFVREVVEFYRDYPPANPKDFTLDPPGGMNDHLLLGKNPSATEYLQSMTQNLRGFRQVFQQQAGAIFYRETQLVSELKDPQGNPTGLVLVVKRGRYESENGLTFSVYEKSDLKNPKRQESYLGLVGVHFADHNHLQVVNIQGPIASGPSSELARSEAIAALQKISSGKPLDYLLSSVILFARSQNFSQLDGIKDGSQKARMDLVADRKNVSKGFYDLFFKRFGFQKPQETSDYWTLALDRLEIMRKKIPVSSSDPREQIGLGENSPGEYFRQVLIRSSSARPDQWDKTSPQALAKPVIDFWKIWVPAFSEMHFENTSYASKTIDSNERPFMLHDLRRPDFKPSTAPALGPKGASSSFVTPPIQSQMGERFAQQHLIQKNLAAQTDPGRGYKNHNEDRYVVLNLKDSDGNEVTRSFVIDGMGGHEGGEFAAVFYQQFLEKFAADLSRPLDRMIHEMDQSIQKHPEWLRLQGSPGAVLVGIETRKLSSENYEVKFSDVGDAEAFVLQPMQNENGKIEYEVGPYTAKKMDEDYQMTLPRPRGETVMARVDPMANRVDQAVGGHYRPGHTSLSISNASHEVKAGSFVIAGSDGLFENYISFEDMKQSFEAAHSSDPVQIQRILMNEALVRMSVLNQFEQEKRFGQKMTHEDYEKAYQAVWGEKPKSKWKFEGYVLQRSRLGGDVIDPSKDIQKDGIKDYVKGHFKKDNVSVIVQKLGEMKSSSSQINSPLSLEKTSHLLDADGSIHLPSSFQTLEVWIGKNELPPFASNTPAVIVSDFLNMNEAPRLWG
ncbi:MAG: hypothetical protein JNK65_04075, partial [Deltaproteobacteria bacterium]|nr:hypothetical protein [Deltaproteobacteria bacterium]